MFQVEKISGSYKNIIELDMLIFVSELNMFTLLLPFKVMLIINMKYLHDDMFCLYLPSAYYYKFQQSKVSFG